MNSPRRPFPVWQIFLGLFLIFSVSEWWRTSQQTKPIPYSDFQQYLKDKKISEVTILEKRIVGTLKAPENNIRYIQSDRVDPLLSKELEAFKIPFKQQQENVIFKFFFAWILPVLIFFWLWTYLSSRAIRKGGGFAGGLMSVGKSKAKIYIETDTKTTFDDVAGVDEAKVELREIVEFLKNPKKYERLGGRMPKGVLLVGPPGTGKTLIAKAVAGEAGVPFFSTNGAEFVEMFVGIGAARVRDLFEQAKQKAPCIIFIDELDALGKVRVVAGIGGNDEKEQTLNQLLAELDGFDSSSGVVLLAATNRPEILDPALLRSGRFDRQVLMDRPDKSGRLAILKIHVKKTKLDENLNLENIAALTPGFTGADLANLVNEASLFAVRRNAMVVAESDFTEAIERMLAGLEKKNRLINKFERKVVAFHEMGHAMVASALNQGGDTIHKISIIPRGVGALGYTLQRPTEDRFLMTKEELEKKMAVLLGGRAAEILIFGHLSTGAMDDLDKATDIAWALSTRYGMADALGHVAYEKPTHTFLGEDSIQARSRNYSDETAREIDCAVKNFTSMALEKALSILKLNESLLRSSATELLEKETLDEGNVKRILSSVKYLNEEKGGKNDFVV